MSTEMNSTTGAHAVPARTGRLIAGPTGQPMLVKVDGQASRGAYSLIEYSHAPSAHGPLAHVHHAHEEAFYVLDGQLTLIVDGETITLNPGECSVAPLSFQNLQIPIPLSLADECLTQLLQK